jgi:CubicO group peptidase (beta-lactamase class C family)
MVPFTSEVTACSSACAIVSSAQDLARWASALYGGGVLDGAEMASMLDTTAALPYPSFIPRGLGAEVISLGGRIAWGHRGHLDGFDGSMMYMPESGITIVVQTNAEWANAVAASATLANVVLGVPPSPSPSPSGASPTPSVSPS